ncbi:tetratricopeptide repeat protein 1-like [Hydractinia symbiolongicarpus]|uniref:tetratricopeptide repeat protein 1-like n=1 Tax=Hydractinia symbiolongicarpus TaxID=13093 RepID=UPI0025509D78|nr:tetratricopeptide repeat protein 1-like [Hydractinia symbiolongicarpus]
MEGNTQQQDGDKHSTSPELPDIKKVQIEDVEDEENKTSSTCENKNLNTTCENKNVNTTCENKNVNAKKTKKDYENYSGKKNTDETEVEEILTEDVKKQKHEDALEFKENGNKLFMEANFEKAITLYSKGVDMCPKSYAKTLAILYSNRAASYVKLEQKEMAIQDCTLALEHDSYYTKARLRRAQMFEAVDRLEDALQDYKEILTYDKSCQQAGEAALRLPEQINERNEKLKAEMFSKLKELGNMCLNPFGLSTDNFKMTQDPNTGGYSINFQK